MTSSNEKISPRLLRQRLASALLSVAMVALALASLWLGQQLKTVATDTLVVREVSTLTPPPPPPPPPVQRPVAETTVTLQVQGEGPVLPMLSVKQQPLELKPPALPEIAVTSIQWQTLDINWSAFELNDLDALPTLLTPLRTVFPKSLTRRGINSARVKLDVMIDELGHVTLINVVENPYPELNSEVQKIVRSSRFTAPQKEGAPVRARFVWPIDIKA